MRIPVLDLELGKPTRGRLAWYAGVATMSALGAIEWPLALIVVTGDVIGESSRSQTVSGAAEGASSAAG